MRPGRCGSAPVGLTPPPAVSPVVADALVFYARPGAGPALRPSLATHSVATIGWTDPVNEL